MVSIIMTMTSREIIKRLKKEGWSQSGGKGSHKVFKHPNHSNHVVVPDPKRDLPIGTVKSIFKMAGWDWKTRK